MTTTLWILVAVIILVILLVAWREKMEYLNYLQRKNEIDQKIDYLTSLEGKLLQEEVEIISREEKLLAQINEVKQKLNID